LTALCPYSTRHSAPRKAVATAEKLLLLDQRVPPKKGEKSETDKGNVLNFGAKKKQKKKEMECSSLTKL
jgi:hypothetical protein